MMPCMLGAAAAKKKPTAGRRKPSGRPRATLLDVYRRLHAAHGPQHWWPGDTAFEIMVGAVLTQNTAWTNVEKAIANLKRARARHARGDCQSAAQKLAAWLKPSGYFNIKAKRLKAMCRWLVEQGGARETRASEHTRFAFRLDCRLRHRPRNRRRHRALCLRAPGVRD